MAKFCASISGGKDSVAMCLELIRRGEKVDYFIFCDTGVEFPECYAALDKFERDTGRKITRLKADQSFEYMMADRPIKIRGSKIKSDGTPKREFGYGWPSMFRRWCTSTLKQDVLKRFYKTLNDEIIEIVGIAADEPKRVRDKRYPLVDWGWTEDDCLRYCKERGYYLSSSVYDYIKRVSCFCCPMSNNKDVDYLINHRPELWARIKELERKANQPWMEWKGKTKDGSFIDCAYLEKKFKKEDEHKSCKYRKREMVDGAQMDMCYAIGCEKRGDMPCEYCSDREEGGE